MAKIFYSMAGEGRGHATRVRTLVESLKNEHEFVLFTSADAYRFLIKSYPPGESDVEVREIPGLIFHYTNSHLDLSRSVSEGFGFVWSTLHGLVADLERQINEEKPDLIITDFEPALPRAALRADVPFISISHQHFLCCCDLSRLPFRLRQYAWFMSWVVRAYHSGQAETVISSFFELPIREGQSNVTQVGPLLRDQIKNAKSENGDYILSYLRPNTPPNVLDSLKRCGQDVRIYGLGERPPEGRVRYFPIDEQTFVDDLAGCAGLIAASGNQLMGESLALGKPVLAIPEAKHHEQQVNAFMVQDMGAGEWVLSHELTSRKAIEFVESLDRYRTNISRFRSRLDGNQDAIDAIHRNLNLAARANQDDRAIA